MTKNLVLPEGISLLWKKMFPSRWAKCPNVVMWDYYALFKPIFNKLPFDYLGSHMTWLKRECTGPTVADVGNI